MFKRILMNVVQALPFIGTLVTANKENTTSNPTGSTNLNWEHLIRLVIGVAMLVLTIKGFLKVEDVPQWMSIFSM